ncbi:MAG: hypothetical protein IJY53_09790, partial [Akkermansia sp.]|nr:hypothetical protein [Akkermansia sp.]
MKCDHDFMGRRVFKKVISGNSTVISHHPPPQTLSAIARRACYACLPSQSGNAAEAGCDLTRTNHPALWLITWDPTEPVATRPLAIQKDGTWYTYGLDLTKNVCEVFGSTGYIATDYTYTPYGKITASSNVQQPIQWSSEFHDEEIGLIYYNYRYFDYKHARWSSRDIISDILCHPYSYVENAPISKFDLWGNKSRYSGTAPVYDVNIWEDYKLFNNCYSYACDVRYTEDMLNEKQKQEKPFRPQPGMMSNTDNLFFSKDFKGHP